MNNEDTISQMLLIVLAVMICIFIILVTIFVVLKTREKIKEKSNNISDKKNKKSTTTQSTVTSYNKQSIMNFMDFEKIEDNMIVQKKGKKYLMVVECQGVNYDLMSKMEKISVEEGFQQFLNTLRHPIQIYIQTRTISLENSLATYRERVKQIEDKYGQMQYQYNQMRESGAYSVEDMDKYFFEITKERNLLEYGKDLVNNTEKMSLNKNVLNKKYYIIIPYFVEEVGSEKYDNEEIKGMAFSELYTKSQSIIRTLSSCSVSGKILSSKELVELLYVAYNRDESEAYGIDRALKAGYEDLYSTASDVFEKKIKVLDEVVEERAVELANQAIEKVKSNPEQIAAEKEKNLEILVEKMAAIILDENKEYLGTDIAEKAKEEIQKSKEKGEKANEESKKTTTRGRKKTTAK
ncbi:MAG: hypothetical protein HFJ36_04760 [Clostridia bacterium]|nr:hypothetical protein [Clostridia bacterium]